MPSTVYFSSIRARKPRENKTARIAGLVDALDIGRIIRTGDLTAVKLHFGERGNDAHLNPQLVRPVVEKLKAAGARPFLTDSAVLYNGSRTNAVDHLETAAAHGFVPEVTGAPVIISDGLRGAHEVKVTVNLRHFRQVRIAGDIRRADSLVVLSHFKGHELAGFGGALKNLAMGCATPAGKKEQHSPRVTVNAKKCTGCGACAEICPADAITLSDEKAQVEKARCIGCFQCVSVCPEKAPAPDWATDLPVFTEKIVEYAFGAVKGKRDRIFYLNYLVDITPHCDCCPWSDAPIVPDIGFVAGTDPVAVDQASLDLTARAPAIAGTLLETPHGAGRDPFSAVWKNTRGDIQLAYAEEVGLGTRTYELVEV